MLRHSIVLGLIAYAGFMLEPAKATLVSADSFDTPLAYTAGEGAWNLDISQWGWTDFGPGAKGVWAPDNTLQDFAQVAPLETPADGNQLLFLGAPNATDFGEAYKRLDTTIELGKTYTLSVAIGNRIAEGLGNWWIVLGDWENPAILASLKRGDAGAVEPTAGHWASNTCQFTADGTYANRIGNHLWVGLFNQAGSTATVFYDNVRVTSVPEPVASLLMASGAIGLLAYAWRRPR